MSGLAFIGSSLSASQRAMDTTSGDMSAQNVNGQRGRSSYFSSQVIKSGGSTIVGSVSQYTKQNVTVAGQISSSTKDTHVAIDGEGFMPVKKAGSNNLLLTRVGTYEMDAAGNLVNENGYIAQGFALDDNGKPAAGALRESLVNVNFLGLTGKPKATTAVDIGFNLDASQDVITGAGQTMKFSYADRFNSSISAGDVIIPNGDNIAIGDKFIVKVADGAEQTYTYGGIATSFNVASGIFGRTSTTDIFASGANYVAPNTVGERHKLRITVGNNAPVELSFVSGSPLASSYQFNSIETLKNAINQIPTLTARISGGVLAIAPTDPTHSVDFANGDTTPFVQSLGLSNIAAGVDRFATMGQLKSLLQGNTKVKVAADGTGLSITAKDPTQSIRFTSSAERKNPVSYIKAVQTDDATSEGAKGLTKLTIMSANNGLKAGDYVRLNGVVTANLFGFGANNGTSNGLYYVTAADDSGFTISGSQIINGLGAVGTASIAAVAPDGTWQKSTGSARDTFNTGGATVDIADGAADMTITVAAFNVGGALHGLVVGETVYISGFGRVDTALNVVSVPDGYYRVTAADAAAGTLHINTTINAANGGHVGAAIGHAINITRIGNSAAANHTMETSMTFIASPNIGQPGVDPNTVRVMMPDHAYSTGDYVGIADVDPAIAVKRFKIVNTDPAGNWFEFVDVDDFAALTAGGGTPLPANKFIDRFGKLDKAIGFSQEKDGTAMTAIYDPSNPTSSLASGSIGGTWGQAITVYDSLGISHDIRMAFAKIGTNKWAVEIFAPKKADGSYEIEGTSGQIAAGTVTFDGTGNIESFGGLDSLPPISWINGSAQTALKINWQDTENASTSAFSAGGVTQVAGGNSSNYINQDGHGAGKLMGIKVDATGNWIASFDNGENTAIFQMPLLSVPAANELKDLGRGVFEATQSSGSVAIRLSGDGSVGSFIGNAIEGSNIDNTDKMTTLAAQVNSYALLCATFKKSNDALENFIRSV